MAIKFDCFGIREFDYKKNSAYYRQMDNKGWTSENLIKHAENGNGEEIELDLRSINLLDDTLSCNNMKSFIMHYKRAFNCDTNIPVILDDYGQIADGYHRIAKAIAEGKTTIKAIRLKSMPEPDINLNSVERNPV